MSVAYVSPAGSGTQSGNSFANAAPWSLTQAVHDALANGDSIRVLAGGGYTAPASPLDWTKRIALGGYNADLSRGRAVIAGARSWPWPANGVWTDSGRYVAATVGINVFNYKDGAAAAGGTTFDWLGFINVGTPFRPLCDSSSVYGDIAVADIRTFNTNGIVYIEADGDGQVSIAAQRCRSLHYSEGMFRAFGGIKLDYCYGDSRSQFHSPGTNLFGVHVQDGVFGVTVAPYVSWFRNCAYLNHDAVAPAGSSQDPVITGNYQQGDGIVCEENTQLLESYNLVLRNNADRGIDLKCAVPQGFLHHVHADGNGFDIAEHDDLVECYITDSYLGSTHRSPGDTTKSSPLQGSGHLTAIRCVTEQNNTGAAYIGAWYGTTQGQQVQAGWTNPQRTGRGRTIDCELRIKSGLAESVNSQGGNPVTTPTYSRLGNTRVVTI